jgi:hypothetical protein
MHLLYLDESGNDPSLPWFVLAGLSVPERQTHWIEQDLNSVASRFAPDSVYDLELHGSPMHTGNKRWRKIAKEARQQAIADALQLGIAARQQYGVRLFGAVIRRDKLPPGREPVDEAFEQLAARFDQMLTRLNRRPHRQPERGLILFDKAANEMTIQAVAREFKYTGHQWGKTRNYAEVPVFLNSETSRLIQLADLVAYALYQHHANQYSRYHEVIASCFDGDGTQAHGLFVLN